MRKIILFLSLLIAQRSNALPASDFTVTDSDGHTHHLYQDYINQGKAVVIEFFFTTCPPCATHAPHLQTLYTQMKQQFAGNVEFFLITTLNSDTNAKVATYKTNKGLTMPGVGYNGNSFDALDEFQSGTYGLFYGTPTFVVIAPNSGEVFFNIYGDSPQETMSKIGTLTTHLLQPPQPNELCDVKTYSGAAIDNLKIHIDATAWDTSYSTAGQYNLAGFPALQNAYPYKFWVSRNDYPLNGVTTYDLVLISKHILGIEPFNADWKRTAADVNNSGTITTFDIVEARKLILGIYDSFPACKSWVFEPDTATDVNGWCTAFMGIKKGDVNGSALANSQAPPATDRAPQLLLETSDVVLPEGARYTVRLAVSEPVSLSGLQAALRLDGTAISIQGVSSTVLSGFSNDNWHLSDNGALTLSWNTTPPVNLSGGEIVVELEVQAVSAVRLSEVLFLDDALLQPEIYCEEGCSGRPLAINWQSTTQGFVFPNPAKKSCTLALFADDSGPDRIVVVDALGKTVYTREVDLRKGENRFYLAPEGLPAGLYSIGLRNRVLARLIWQN